LLLKIPQHLSLEKGDFRQCRKFLTVSVKETRCASRQYNPGGAEQAVRNENSGKEYVPSLLHEFHVIFDFIIFQKEVSMFSYHDVLLEQNGGIATVTLNRPKARNAFNRGVLEGLYEAANHILSEPSVGVVILTGAGDQAFCAGIDLKMISAGEDLNGNVKRHDRFGQIQIYRDCFTAYEKLPVPVIAAINGFCFGAGLELALGCDIRLADETALFSIPEVQLGIIPDGGGTQRLPKIVGVGKAKELIYTGRKIDAQEALRIGLVEHVYPKSRLMEEAGKMAQEIVNNGAPVIGCKRAINIAVNYSSDVGLQFESSTQQAYLQGFQQGAAKILKKVKDSK
jgi:enoyl-CoA hydratase/carnithine racemase